MNRFFQKLFVFKCPLYQNLIIKTVLICLIVSSALLISCNYSLTTKSRDKISVSYDFPLLSLSNNTNKTYKANLFVNDSQINDVVISKDFPIDLVNEIQRNALDYFELATKLAINNDKLSVRICIDRVLDTTLLCKIKTTQSKRVNVEIVEGTGAKLIESNLSTNTDAALRKWLYKNGYRNISDTIIDKAIAYIEILNRKEYQQYLTNEEIPIIKSFKDIKYLINADLISDNYYLLATNKEKDIEDFIEEKISKKFDGAIHSLDDTIYCYRNTSLHGVIPVFLIGIDNDWNSSYIPVLLVCVDNIAPYTNNEQHIFNNNSLIDTCRFENKKIEILSGPTPDITGHISMNSGNWQGWGTYKRVPFTFYWSGDVEKVIFHRGDDNKEEIVLKDKVSPYHIDISCKLPLGDNYFLVEVFDKVGNKSTFSHHERCVEVKDDNPSINIDNNIYNGW